MSAVCATAGRLEILNCEFALRQTGAGRKHVSLAYLDRMRILKVGDAVDVVLLVRRCSLISKPR